MGVAGFNIETVEKVVQFRSLEMFETLRNIRWSKPSCKKYFILIKMISDYSGKLTALIMKNIEKYLKDLTSEKFYRQTFIHSSHDFRLVLIISAAQSCEWSMHKSRVFISLKVDN